jgi:hypothetical protein
MALYYLSKLIYKTGGYKPPIFIMLLLIQSCDKPTQVSMLQNHTSSQDVRGARRYECQNPSKTALTNLLEFC